MSRGLIRLGSKAISISRRKAITFAAGSGSKAVSLASTRFASGSKLKNVASAVMRNSKVLARRSAAIFGLLAGYHALRLLFTGESEELDQQDLVDQIEGTEKSESTFDSRLLVASSDPSDENIIKALVALGAARPHLIEASHFAIDSGLTMNEVQLNATIRDFNVAKFVREVKQTPTLDLDKRISDLLRAKSYSFVS